MVTIGNGTTEKVTETSPSSAATAGRAPGRETFGPAAAHECAASPNAMWRRCASELADVRGDRAHGHAGRHGSSMARKLRHDGHRHRSGFLCGAGLDFRSGPAVHRWRNPLGQPVCVIGKTVTDSPLRPADPVGLRLRVGSMSCEVIGVLDGKGQSAFGRTRTISCSCRCAPFSAASPATRASRRSISRPHPPMPFPPCRPAYRRHPARTAPHRRRTRKTISRCAT